MVNCKSMAFITLKQYTLMLIIISEVIVGLSRLQQRFEHEGEECL